MNTYLSDQDKAKVAYLLGRLTSWGEAALQEHGGEGWERNLADLLSLRKLLLPCTVEPDPAPDLED